MTNPVPAHALTIFLGPALPLLVVLVAALTTLLMSAFMRRRALAFRPIAGVAVAAAVGAFVATWHAWIANPSAAVGMLSIDRATLVVWLVIFLAAALVLLLSVAYLPEGHHIHTEYYALVLFAVFGLGIVAAAGDLVTLIVGIEIAGLASYVLTGILRYRLKSNEAAVKYFLIGSFALAFLVTGAAFVFGATGTTDMTAMGSLVPRLVGTDAWWFFLFGCAMLAVGIGFTIAAVPFHAWAPDVYDGAPLPIAAFISTAAKAAGFVALMKLASAALSHTGQVWITVCATLSIATMTVGNITALAQENIKRLLAYSSIAHAGYMLVAFPAMARGSGSATAALIFYLFAYTAMTIGAFAVTVALNEGREEQPGIAAFAGIGRTRPAMAAALTLFLVSLAGFPPTFGFFAKYYLFLTVVREGFAWLVIVSVINSAVAVYYYLRPVMIMYLHDGERTALSARTASVSAPVVAVIVLCALMVVFFGILPGNLLELILHSV